MAKMTEKRAIHELRSNRKMKNIIEYNENTGTTMILLQEGHMKMHDEIVQKIAPILKEYFGTPAVVCDGKGIVRWEADEK